MTWAEMIQEQAKTLPVEQAREVLDFIGYLKTRQENQEWQNLTQAQSNTLEHVWDNPDDEVWNHV